MTHGKPLPTSPAMQPPGDSSIGATLVVCLGLSQLVAWGTMHYLIAVFGRPIGQEMGWSAAFVQGGFSLALVVMGSASALAGRWIDAQGGRAAMMTGCWIGAAGCALLTTTTGAAQYLAGWALLGLGMRLALYDAAFAALAHLGGAASKRAMSQITLFGGLASTVFWPLGQALAQALGWRGALGVYALFLLLASSLHLAIPAARAAAHAPRHAAPANGRTMAPARADTLLYGLVAVLAMVMQTGISAHFIELLRGLGWSASVAVTLSALLGIGQFTGRVWVVAWGHRYNAIRLNLLPSALLAGGYAVSLAAGTTLHGAAAFAFLYGAGNGIATITRGAMPLLLFDTASYGRIVGAVLKPAFVLSAAAPVALALALDGWGHAGTLWLMLATSLVLLAASAALARRHTPRRG
ncbi:MFS transporter [Alicycliphilus denitrificans]|nr:MFS transporter [Alicycliphilus denitrificans]